MTFLSKKQRNTAATRGGSKTATNDAAAPPRDRATAISPRPGSRLSSSGESTSGRRARRSRGDVAIPEREQILQALREQGVPMPAEQLAELLGVRGDAEREAFGGRLAAMERDGQLMTNRKGQLCVVAKLDLVTGTVQGHPDGFGFLVPDDGGPDLFLSAKEMHKTLH
ncbi:MAG TPA: winged-helix domain-containing protein, partial [Casimicrobiaceae bacterium]